ncbi:MAG: TRAP transporter substrate-binding protein [Deltaproteobacteria bacterium]|nr:TRAP transporter substrate-binding protein [Deltaproteobacteria bacterium]
MRFKTAAVGFIALAFILFWGGPTKALELKFGHYAAETHPGHKAAVMFADAVQKRTKGKITTKIYPANQLGSPPEVLEQNKLGVIDMSLPTQGALDKYVKAFAVVMLPFAYDSYDHAYKVLDGPFMKWVAPTLKKENLVFLSNWEWGFRNITNNVRPVNSPEDVKGLKIRVPPEIQLQAAMEACGAVVTKIAFPELYMALKQGVVDGQENPLAVIYHFKIYEVQKYLALTRHVYNSMVHVMSLKTWEKLTSQQQKIVREESKRAGNYFRKAIQDEEKDLVAKLKEKGMVVTTPDISKFRSVMGPAYERIGKYAGEDNVKKFMKMVEDAR